MSRAARAALVAAVLIIALLVVGIGVERRRAAVAEGRLGLDAARVVSAVFAQAQDLRVATLTGKVIARSQNDGTLFHSEQVTRTPYSVSYVVDLGRVARRDYRWDAARRVMTVEIPDVATDAPNIDMARGEVLSQRGLWISRSAATRLQRDGAALLSRAAATKAMQPDNVAAARAAAKRAVARLIRQPLEAAGIGPVAVVVHVAGEARPSTEQWDRSTSLDEIYR